MLFSFVCFDYTVKKKENKNEEKGESKGSMVTYHHLVVDICLSFHSASMGNVGLYRRRPSIRKA